MSSGVNHNIDGARHVKWSESQYRCSESHQVLRSLVKPNILLSVGPYYVRTDSTYQDVCVWTSLSTQI